MWLPEFFIWKSQVQQPTHFEILHKVAAISFSLSLFYRIPEKFQSVSLSRNSRLTKILTFQLQWGEKMHLNLTFEIWIHRFKTQYKLLHYTLHKQPRGWRRIRREIVNSQESVAYANCIYAVSVFFIYALLTPHIRQVEGENVKKTWFYSYSVQY